MKLAFKNFILFLFVTGIYSCSKPGQGGKATVVAFVQHHGKTIKNHAGWPDTVFVKFNAKEFPGTKPGDYDAYFVGEEGEDHVHCEGLKWGDYYFYATGVDSTGPYRVTGGLNVKIKYGERKEEIDLNIPVSE